MALEYKILDTKATVNVDGEEFIDLLTDNVIPLDVMSGQPIVVNEHYVARPDLISLAMYGEDDYADIICKVNGISNPFEINEDDILYIPSIETVMEFIKKTRKASEFVTPDKDDDVNISVNNESDNFKKLLSDTRAPNEQTINDSNYIIDRSLGLVFY
nr:MAG TPA: hypothetical protein [Caudoviricetes sp.]